jgi:hypothetical protein
MGSDAGAETSASTAVALTPTLVKWVIAAHLSAISAWFFAFGAALLIDQSQDAAISDAVRRELPDATKADAVIAEIRGDSAETALNFLVVGGLGWLVLAALALALTLTLFLTTGLCRGLKDNVASYKVIVIGLLAAGSAFIAATISNFALTFAGTAAPWLFLVPGVLALAGGLFLGGGLLRALWTSARGAVQRRTGPQS